LLFVVIDTFLERRGGWMRRLTAKRKQLMKWRSRRVRPLLAKLGHRRKSSGIGQEAPLEALELVLEAEVRLIALHARTHARPRAMR
jgi:hypothetical protein